MGSIRDALEFMVDNTRVVYLDRDFQKLSTTKEAGSTEITVSKEIYDALVLVEKEYNRLIQK